MKKTNQLSVPTFDEGCFTSPLRRLLCFFLSAVLLLALIPASAVAASHESTAVPSQEASTPPLGSGEATYTAPADAIPDPAAVVKPQVKDPHAKRVREIIEERTATTKTYELSDGQRQIVASTGDIHYKGDHNQFVDISTNLVASGSDSPVGAVTTLSTENKTSFSASGTGAATISADTTSSAPYSVSFTYCGQQLSSPLTLGDTAVYLDPTGNTTLQYQALSGGVKETLLLNTPTTKNTYDFRLDFSGLSLKQDKGTWELVKADGSVAYLLSDLVVEDSGTGQAGSSICPNTSWELLSSSAASARFRATINEDWLGSKDRAWPVKIDPTATVAVAADACVNSVSPTTTLHQTELLAGCTTSTGNKYRSYITFDALPNLAGVSVSKVTFSAYQTRCFTTAAATSYLAQASAAIPTNVNWNNKPAMSSAIASTSITGTSLWATYDITSTLTGPLTSGTAFYGLVLYESEATPLTNNWHAFSSVAGGNAPYITITCSSLVQPVKNLSATTSASGAYFKETDKNKDGVADNKNDYPDAGRGSVKLSWSADSHATGYHIYTYDGVSYRQVGTTLGRNNITWSTSGAGLYPTDTTVAGYGADGTYAGNPYTAGQSPSPATRVSSATLTYPAGTPYTTGTNGGSGGSGIVVPDGKYIYVKAWGAYKGPAKWVRFTQTNYPNAKPAYGSPVILGTTDSVPQSLGAFVLNGVLYDGAITASTANATTIAAYAESTFESTTARRLSFTFDKPLLSYSAGTDIAAGTTGYGVMLTSDGAHIYSVGKVGQGFSVRQYNDTGHFEKDWSISVANTTAFGSFDSVTSDGYNLYLMEWTSTNLARTYKVSLSSHLLTDSWLQSDQATKCMVSFSYDATSKRFIGGNLSSGTNVDTFAGSGLDLRDNPNAIYRKSKTTTYQNNVNYWFRVAAYDANGETAVYSASVVSPTLDNRTVRVSDNPNPGYTQLGTVAGQSVEAAEGRAATRIISDDLTIATYGPAAAVSRTYLSDMASTSSYLPKGWRFSFEQNMTTLSTGAVQYTDGAGTVILFAQDPKNTDTYLSPAGMFSTLTKTSSGFTLKDADGAQHLFGSDGKITSDCDRNNNKTTYSYGSGGAIITAANGQKLELAKDSATSYTLTLEGVSASKTFTYAISGNNMTVTEYEGSPREVTDTFTSDASGRITSVSRGQDSATITYGTASVSFAHTTSGAPPAPATMTYSKRSTNVGQAVLDKGSATAQGGFAAGQERQVFLTDPTGQEIWASASVDQLYGTNTSYNAYNQVIVTKDPVSASADGLTFTNCPASVGVAGATKSDYDSRGNQTYALDKAGLETWYYYNSANDLIKMIDNARAVTWNDVDSKGNILVTEKLIAANGARKRTEYSYNTQGFTTQEKTALSKNADGSYIFDIKDYSDFACDGNSQKTIEHSVQLATSATPQDITTSCAIDDCGNRLSNTDGRGIITDTSTYDVAGSLLTSTDKTGLVTTNVYDNLGNVTETYQLPSGSSVKSNWTKTTYDAQGNTLTASSLDSAGTAVEITTMTHDVLGREAVSDSNSEQGASVTTCDLAGNVIQAKSEGTLDGVTTTTKYDASGQEIQSSNVLGTTTTPYSAPTTTTYNAAGNVTSTKTTGQPDQSTTYDVSGNAITQTNGGVTDTCDYDLVGNVISDKQSASGKPDITTVSTYDLAGRLLTTKMGTQTATTNIYNVRGDILSKTDFDSVTTTYSYDRAGNQLTEKVGADDPTTTTYDNASRVTKQVNPDGTEVDYTYDGLSRITEQKELKDTVVLKDIATTFDSAGRPSVIDESVSGYKQAFTYQNTGAGINAQTVTTKTETYADGTTQTSIVNGALLASDTLTPKFGSSLSAANTSYDEGGRPTARSVGAQSSQLSYDSQGNLTGDTNLSAPGQKTYTYDANDSKLTSSSYSRLGAQSASYTYSADRTQLASAKVSGTTTAYAYNATTGDITQAGATSYSYDTAGRLAGRTSSSGGFIVSTAFSFNYDGLGRRISDDHGVTYGWSGQRLVSGYYGGTGPAKFTCAYDAEGQRLSKTAGNNTTNYLYDGTKLVSLAAKSSTETQSIIYLYGSGSTPVGACYSTTTTATTAPVNFEIVSDARGDVRELRDTNGDTFARYDYDAFGNITSDTEFATSLIALDLAQQISAAQPLRYAGYVWDAEAGLYYCSQRYYDPTTASFISRDPVKADGEKSPYMYCAGEPVGGTDPSGLDSTVRYGSQGATVKKLQRRLNTFTVRGSNGKALAEDGIFGTNTLAAVKKFQSMNGLIVDGIVGPKTWGWINEPTANFNCYSYAMNIHSGCKYPNDSLSTVENFRKTVIKQVGSSKARAISGKNASTYSNEYRIAIRVCSFDFHFMKQDTHGYGYWSEKHGHISSPISEIQYHNFSVNPDVWGKNYGNNGGIIYNSKTLYLAIKFKRQ